MASKGKMNSPNVRLSIIVVSWNVKEDLVRCLRSIEENRPCDEFEVIVADNASTDGTVDVIKRDFPEVVTVTNSENRGFAAANNQGIEKSRGEYILFLNPDTIVHSQSLDNLVKILDERPTAGACGPRITDTDGKTCPSIGYVPTFRSILYRKTIFRSLGIFRAHYHKLTIDNFDYDREADVEQLSGAAIMVRRSLMNEIGLMDESFFLYYDDVDLFLRIRKAGWKITYVPEAKITHKGGRSTHQISAKKTMILHQSMFIYLRKHHGKLATAIFGLVFKPAVVAKEISNVFSGIITFIISLLLFNRKRQVKSLTKVTNSAIFLAKYSWEFIFST